jgi:hypothetical protein
MNKILLIPALLLAFGSSYGATYKCKNANGKTVFSDTACSGIEAEPMHVDNTASAAPSEEEATQRCFALHQNFGAWFDRPSIRMEGHSVKWVTVKDVGARQLISVMINGKNRYGAYVGSSPYNCLWMPDGRVLGTAGFEIRD